MCAVSVAVCCAKEGQLCCVCDVFVESEKYLMCVFWERLFFHQGFGCSIKKHSLFFTVARCTKRKTVFVFFKQTVFQELLMHSVLVCCTSREEFARIFVVALFTRCALRLRIRQPLLQRANHRRRQFETINVSHFRIVRNHAKRLLLPLRFRRQTQCSAANLLEENLRFGFR